MMLPEPTTGSILARTARGAGWVMAWRMLTRLLGLCSTLVLVRLLSPADFGLVALATAFALALDVCLAIGVEDQIIRAPNPRPALYHTAFTMSLLRSLAVACIIGLCAGPAAAFFGDARLRDVLWALAASAALSGATNIGVVDFRRHLSFEREFQLQLLPRLVGIAITLGAAWWLQSHWALVLGILANRFGIVVMSHALHPYHPRLSLEAWRELIGVSCWSWAISLATVLRDRADSMVVGRMLGPAPLGIYAVGVEVAILPTTEIVDPICRACMPGFAATLRGGGNTALADAWLRVMALMAVLTLPAGTGASLVAGPLVALAFGPAWMEAVPVIIILGLACTVALFGNVSGALLNARTALRSILGITLAAAMLRITLLLLLTPWLGLAGAGLAIGVAVVLEHLALVTAVLRLLHMPPRRLLACIHRPALATAAMALLLWALGLGWAAPPPDAAAALQILLRAIPLGMASFTLALWLLWRSAGSPAGAEADMLALLRGVLGRAALWRPRHALRGS
jgi:O-antigen/teichoic acid export membrane protein